MGRILSVFTNCFGADGVRAAVENVRKCGFDHVELALRGHDFGGLVIPESAVITPDSDSRDVVSFVELLKLHGVGISGCNVGGADLRTLAGRDLTERRIRFSKRIFDVEVVVSGAGQPADSAERVAILKNLKSTSAKWRRLWVSSIALETHKGPTQNASEMLQLMGEIDHP